MYPMFRTLGGLFFLIVWMILWSVVLIIKIVLVHIPFSLEHPISVRDSNEIMRYLTAVFKNQPVAPPQLRTKFKVLKLIEIIFSRMTMVYRGQKLKDT